VSADATTVLFAGVHDAGRSQTAASAATVDDEAAAHPRRGSISKR
jgi:hypothetical protein